MQSEGEMEDDAMVKDTKDNRDILELLKEELAFIEGVNSAEEYE